MSQEPQTVADDFVGRVIDDRYAIVSKLGEGGMGAVYEAEQIALQRRVALKVIHPSFAGDGEVRARFAREATASGQLDGHPHVASALDFGTLPDGSLYLVMQLVSGPSLREILDRGALPWERALQIATQIADALSAAHAKGIVHRDLKPDNVSMIRREDDREVAKVLDFGIARVMTPSDAPPDQQTKLTRVGTIMGTPGYMAPEQAVGDAVDERADLYALGVMIWEMLVGRIPFDGPDFTTIVGKQFAETPEAPSVAAKDPTIPAELDRVVLSLLARSPAERPASASEVLRTLEQIGRASTTEFRPATGSIALSGQRASAQTTVQPGLPALPKMDPEVLRRQLEELRPKLEAKLPEKLRPHSLVIGASIVGLLLFVLIVVVGKLVFAPPAPGTPAAVEAAVRTDADDVPALSPELAAAVETLANSEEAAARAAAASTVAAAADNPAMPPYAVQLAALETARSCRVRKAAVAELIRIDDERALRYVRRLHESPRRGCGFLNSRDCHACMRDELAQAVDELGGL